MNRRSSNTKIAYVGIFLLGIVSLMGDIVYEGGRGLAPDYLRFLGASAVVVGIVGGLGEFLGYALRLVGGYLADTTRAYWFFIFLGYGLILSLPLLGFARIWEIAIILILLERFGKALRSPSRDTVLSIISKGIGTGKAFGIHELLDQMGAIAGPLIVATMMLYSNNDYQQTFTFLLFPFIILLLVLVHTYRKIGTRTIITSKIKSRRGFGFGKRFFIYTFAVMLNTIGLIPVALLLYKASTILQPMQQQWMVPLIYLLIQGVDASIALLSGYAYDKFGVKILTIPFILSVFPPLFALVDTGLSTLIMASVFFGMVLGMQESIYRAAVSEFTPISSRGAAYGVFNTAYGVGFLISGGIYGVLMDFKAPFLIIIVFVILTQSTATAALLRAGNRVNRPRAVR